jgi:transcriptional regulator with XRE-family HTH domain
LLGGEPVTFASLPQEELAEAAALSVRAVSYLERGRTAPQKETVRLRADALGLIGPARAEFEASARGRPAPGGVAAATRTLPRDIASFTGRQQELEQLAKAAARVGGVVSIHAIGGMAWVSKTAFAVHAAHRLASGFPGGQIFLAAARAHSGAAAGGSRGCAGQLAADRGGPGRADPARAGDADGAVAGPAGRAAAAADPRRRSQQ